MSETIPYRPSNGTEGEGFEAKWCQRCEYERKARESEVESGCDILGLALALDIDNPAFPEHWISDPDGSNPRCTRFRLEGTGTHEQIASDLARYHAAMAEMKASQR